MGDISPIISDMSPIALTGLIELLAVYAHKSPATIGRKAAGSGNFYHRLKRGHDITTRKAASVTQWLSNNWPADLPWPLDIPRPTPAPDSPAVKSLSADPLIDALALNDQGRILCPNDLCAALQTPRYVYDRVIRHYADGKPRAGLSPHANTDSAQLLKLLTQSGDVRFNQRRERLAKFARLAGAA